MFLLTYLSHSLSLNPPLSPQVGRSCCVIKYKGRTIVCDAGVHPAFTGMAALPFLDELDWSTVDAILITHFHLDHAASLTYIMEKVTFFLALGTLWFVVWIGQRKERELMRWWWLF